MKNLNLNNKTLNTTKRVLKKTLNKLPDRAIEAGTALAVTKALGSNRRTATFVSTITVLVLTHVIIEWAKTE